MRRFWQAPNLVDGRGFKAVEMFDAIAAGDIKALWVMGTNPAVSLPRCRCGARGHATARVPGRLGECRRQRHASSLAHMLLPAAAWGEKNGTVTNSERRISRQRPFLSPAGEAQGRLVDARAGGRRLGWGGGIRLSQSPPIFSRARKALRALKTTALAPSTSPALRGLGRQAYDALEPIQWPPAARSSPRRACLPTAGSLPDGTARFVAIARLGWRPPQLATWPFVLNTGRIRDQWHTMTRTGPQPATRSHRRAVRRDPP